jgi:ferric-dicitrate binding protein FerR (iron transport regulator)
MDKETIIRKWLNDTLTAEERKYFETDAAFAPTRRLHVALQAFRAPAYDVDSERARLPLPENGKIRQMGRGWIKPFMQIAASLLVLFSLYYLFVYEPYTVVETAAGQRKELILPDGSRVHLNAQSTLRYNGKTWDEERTLALEGEAFFSAEKGGTFEVRTDAGSVRVLGTAFNVKQRKDLFAVDCYEGLVQVSYPGDSRKLAANQGISVIRGKATAHAPDREERPPWLAGESVFRSIPYIYVVEELERQYGVKVTLHNIDTQQLFTGSFDHADLNHALQTITQPLGTSYRIDKKHHTVVIGE